MSVDWLLAACEMDNLATELGQDELSRIGSEVVRNFELDVRNRSEWDQTSEEALKLAKLIRGQKNTPWPDAANVQFPLITVASLHFNARAYPEIVKSGHIVKCKPMGYAQEDRARRIANHMNWQLLFEMEDWQEEMDRLLMVLPVVGQCFKKIYYDPLLARPVSRLVLPDECYVNSGAPSMRAARRITHIIRLYQNDVIERQRAGLWLDVDLGLPPSVDGDTDTFHEFLEQHCYLDLDGDGYKEPYVVTVHRRTSKVVRILARWQPHSIVVDEDGQLVRIEPDHYFIHFGFIPNPDGSMNYFGFGHLMSAINYTVNTCINQMIDSGTLYNSGGGFIGRGVKLRGGTLRFSPGEWKLVDVAGPGLKESIVPLPTREPSSVLFQLLSFLVSAGRDISAVQEILSGDIKFGPNMPVGTAMALVEQGLKVYTAIFKRIHRSLTEEFRRLYDLNARTLPAEFTFYLDEKQHLVGASDYREGDVLVLPHSDPHISSDMQRLLRAQALQGLSGRPGINEVEVTRRLVKAVSPEDAELVLLTDEQISGKQPVAWRPPPAPQMVLAQAKAALAQARAQESALRLQMELANHRLELESLMAEVVKKKADAVLALAKAADIASDTEVKEEAKRLYDEMAALEMQVATQIQALREVLNLAKAGAEPGGVDRLEGPAYDPLGLGISPASPE